MQCFRHVVVHLENYLKRKKHSNGKKEIQNLIGEIKSIETFSIAQYKNLETNKNIHKSKIRFIYVIMLKSKQKISSSKQMCRKRNQIRLSALV